MRKTASLPSCWSFQLKVSERFTGNPFHSRLRGNAEVQTSNLWQLLSVKRQGRPTNYTPPNDLPPFLYLPAHLLANLPSCSLIATICGTNKERNRNLRAALLRSCKRSLTLAAPVILVSGCTDFHTDDLRWENKLAHKKRKKVGL